MPAPIDPTNMSPITIFLSGVYMTTFIAAGLVFFRVGSKVHDRFFRLFGGACLVLGLERIPLVFIDASVEENSWVYIFRIIAFMLIIGAIIDANRRDRQSD